MGLVNARNLRKAKSLLDQNRHKVGDIVGKATDKLDQVSGGKTANLSKKAGEAARKYSAGGAGAGPDDIIESDIVESDIVESDIVESDIVESDIVESDIVESDIVESDDQSPLPPPPLRPPPPPPPAT